MTVARDDQQLTPHERLIFGLCLRLDSAFKRDPSVGAMNRVYRKIRTGLLEIDRELRDHIGLLYMFEEARPALLADARREQAAGESFPSAANSMRRSSSESAGAFADELVDVGRSLDLQHSALPNAGAPLPLQDRTPSCRSQDR